MMKRIKPPVIITALLLSVMTACTEEAFNNSSPTSNEDVTFVQNPTEQIAIENALKEAVNLLNEQGDTRATPIPTSFGKFHLQALRNIGTTRNDESKEGNIYAVNFGQNEGFSIISTIPGLPHVFAFSSTGDFTFDRSQNCESVNSYIDWLDYQATTAAGTNRDTLVHTPNPPLVPWPGKPNLPTTKTIVSPILTDKVTAWHQNYPYNKYIPLTSDGYRCPVGCVALACAQVMSAFQWPESYDGVNYDWNAMRNGQNTDMVARLMTQLGYPHNLNVRYAYPESVAYSDAIPRTFKNFGYQTPHFNPTYNASWIYSSLIQNYPVIVGGNNQKTGKGHCWVIDGLLYRYLNDLEDPSLGGTRTVQTYYHCVWGTPLYINGWFYFTTETDSFDVLPESMYNAYYKFSNLLWMADIRK